MNNCPACGYQTNYCQTDKDGACMTCVTKQRDRARDELRRVYRLLNQYDDYEIADRVSVARRDHGWVVYIDAFAAELNGDKPVYHPTLPEALMSADLHVQRLAQETNP